MSNLETRALEVLRHYMSEPAANGVLRRADLRSARRGPRPDGHDDEYVQELLVGAKIFARQSSQRQLEHELRKLSQRAPLPTHGVRETHPICDEHHARRARMRARRLAESVGAGKLDCLRAATGLSELTRNILMYAGSGEVTIEIFDDPCRIRLTARDQGPGIPDVGRVLRHDYQSKTGLGRGLQGTKKLADHFEIESSPAGTRVVFEMRL